MRPTWDEHFMARAHANATMSTCASRRVGCVATRGNRSFADGFNGNLPGEVHCDEGGCDRCADGAAAGTGLERCVCVHAEQNLVAYCAATGTPLAGATLYTTTRPCLDCLKLVISAGVVEVVYDEEYPGSTWVPQTKSPFTARRYLP